VAATTGVTNSRFGLPGWLYVGTLLSIGAYGGLLVVALLDPKPDTLAALAIAPVLVLLTVPIAMRIARADGDPGILLLLLIAVALKLTASVVRYYVAFDVYGGLADAAGYHAAGAAFAPDLRSLHFGVETGVIPGTGFIDLITGIVYAITGASQLTGFFVFAWLSMLGQILCWRAFKIGVPEGDNKRYALLILFFPTMLYWPASIGKEAWMLLAIGITLYGAARMLQRRPMGVVLTILGVAGLTLCRPHVALVVLACLLTALLVQRSPSRSPLTPVVRLVSIALVVAVSLVVVSQTESFFGVQSLNQETVQTTLSETELSTGQGGSSFTPVTVNTPLDLPLATTTVLFRPLPFEAHNAQMLLTSFEGLFLLGLCIVSWRRLAAVPRLMRSTPYVAFAFVFVLLFVYAFSSFGNFGILARQRTQVLPFLFVLLALPPLVGRRSVRSTVATSRGATAPAPHGRFGRWTRARSPSIT
jgi:hypothetical protein